jgi:hypothetical protein
MPFSTLHCYCRLVPLIRVLPAARTRWSKGPGHLPRAGAFFIPQRTTTRCHNSDRVVAKLRKSLVAEFLATRCVSPPLPRGHVSGGSLGFGSQFADGRGRWRTRRPPPIAADAAGPRSLPDRGHFPVAGLQPAPLTSGRGHPPSGYGPKPGAGRRAAWSVQRRRGLDVRPLQRQGNDRPFSAVLRLPAPQRRSGWEQDGGSLPPSCQAGCDLCGPGQPPGAVLAIRLSMPVHHHRG